MTQHFLLSTKARTLSLAKDMRLSDAEAYETFKQIRWAENYGEPFCPRCGCNAFHRSRGNQYRYSVNARCLADLDELLANNKIWFVNGRDHPFDRHSEEIETMLMPYRAHVGELPRGIIKK